MTFDSNHANIDRGSGSFDEEFLDGLALDLVLHVRSEQEILKDTPEGDRPALSALLAEVGFLERVEDLRGWVGSTRDQLSEWKGNDDGQNAELSSRILAASTRNNRFQALRQGDEAAAEGAWGDAKILMGFVRRRLASSVALRVAAASLIAHLIALPALAAYIYWVRPDESKLVIRFDPNQPVLPEELEGAAPEERFEEDADLWSALGLEESNAIAVARYGLTHAEREGRTRGVREPWAGWVSLRLQRLESGVSAPDWSSAPWEEPASLGHVFALEMLLDDCVLGRTPWEATEGYWALLVPMLEVDAVPSNWRALVTHTLRRAEEYGLLRELDSSLGSEIRPGGGDPLDGDPLGAAWFEALRELQPGSALDLKAWVDWFGEQN